MFSFRPCLVLKHRNHSFHRCFWDSDLCLCDLDAVDQPGIAAAVYDANLVCGEFKLAVLTYQLIPALQIIRFWRRGTALTGIERFVSVRFRPSSAILRHVFKGTISKNVLVIGKLWIFPVKSGTDSAQIAVRDTGIPVFDIGSPLFFRRISDIRCNGHILRSLCYLIIPIYFI